MVHKVLTHSPALCGLAANPALPVGLLDRFVAAADPELSFDLADRDDLTPEQSRRLAARGGVATTIFLVRRHLLSPSDVDAPDPRVALALLDETEVPEAWTRALYGHPDPVVRAELAEAAYLPADVLASLADDHEVEVVAAVARSARLTSELVSRLADHPHRTVRRSVAFNEVTPPAVLAALAADTDLAYALVSNPATPGEAIAGSTEHPEAYVRMELAGRPDLTQHSYAVLAADPIPGVRAAVAENPAIGEHLIRSLAGDDTPEVRRCLAHNPVIPLDVLTRIAPVTKIGPRLLPRIASATPDEINTLAHSPVAAIRMMLAERPDLPAAVVTLLADDPDAKVLKSLVHHSSLTDEQLRAIVSRHGIRVVAAVARNSACGAELLHELAARTPPVQKALRVIAAHPNADAATLLRCLSDRQARPIAARHPALPTVAITEVLNDADADVVEAAAANPSLPHASMEDLISGETSRQPQ